MTAAPSDEVPPYPLFNTAASLPPQSRAPGSPVRTRPAAVHETAVRGTSDSGRSPPAQDAVQWPGDRTGPALPGVRAGNGWGSVVAVPPNETKECRHG
ncbi:hypothetical protein GCM10010361_47600 [Streptomyces olivaceiscleroticus]|uniref:Uncharacterized protein n=1 Tax=Streptomyces olivaceiscleroticus TaxID=68245 RepID=A0ABP3KE55_9ACTN